MRVSEKDYKKGHLPGAVSAPCQPFTDVRGKPGQPGWGVLLPKEKLPEKLGALGIDGETSLVVYADPPGWGEDGRFAWMCKMAGIDDARILDGGYQAWKNAGGEVTKKMPSTSSAGLHRQLELESVKAQLGYLQETYHCRCAEC